MQDRSPLTRQNLLATHGRTIHWVIRAHGVLFALDFAAQLGDMVFLVDEARRGTVGSEI